jgi:CBS domain-containing protein
VVVPVRDTLTASDEAPAAEFARPVFTLDADTTAHAGLKSMRETRNHLAVVTDGGSVVGLITLADVLRRPFRQAATAAARRRIGRSRAAPPEHTQSDRRPWHSGHIEAIDPGWLKIVRGP